MYSLLNPADGATISNGIMEKTSKFRMADLAAATEKEEEE